MYENENGEMKALKQEIINKKSRMIQKIIQANLRIFFMYKRKLIPNYQKFSLLAFFKNSFSSSVRK
jgi:hypothetical protein